MKKSKNLFKKSIDIESEFAGIPVGQKTPKEKKNDLTKDINIFLGSPITLESIKNILSRLNGRWTCDKPEISKIKIYKLNSFSKEYPEFFIYIQREKTFQFKYYLSKYTLYELGYLSPKRMNLSSLKQNLAEILWQWFILNPQVCET